MQGRFNVLLPSSATKTSLLLSTLTEKHKPGEFWHTQSSTNLTESLSRSKASCQPLGLMHAVGQDKRALGLGSRSHHGYSSSRHYLGCIHIYTARLEPCPGPLHTTPWLDHFQEISSGEDQHRSCGVSPVSSVPEESKLGSAPPALLKRAGLRVVCLDERQDIFL